MIEIITGATATITIVARNSNESSKRGQALWGE